jgi:hypothetical protein
MQRLSSNRDLALPSCNVHELLGGSRSQVVTNDSHQINTPTKPKDNEHEQEREHGTGNRTTTTRLAQIEFVQGRRSLQAGRCPSYKGSWGLACIDGQQRHWPHILPGPRAQLGWRESDRLTMRCSEPGHRAPVAIVASRGPGR